MIKNLISPLKMISLIFTRWRSVWTNF
jgi:hypothetical protein